MDDLIDRIENARSDADFFANRGAVDGTRVSLSRDDCTEIGAILTKAYACVLQGKQDVKLADQLVLLSSAFEGDA